jgi:hypothetical protein
MGRTTILLPDDLLLEVRRVAQTKRITVTDIIKNALRAYMVGQPHAGLPSFTAVSRTKGPGSRDLARRAKKLARGVVDPYEGSRREGQR